MHRYEQKQTNRGSSDIKSREPQAPKSRRVINRNHVQTGYTRKDRQASERAVPGLILLSGPIVGGPTGTLEVTPREVVLELVARDRGKRVSSQMACPAGGGRGPVSGASGTHVTVDARRTRRLHISGGHRELRLVSRGWGARVKVQLYVASVERVTNIGLKTLTPGLSTRS